MSVNESCAQEALNEVDHFRGPSPPGPSGPVGGKEGYNRGSQQASLGGCQENLVSGVLLISTERRPAAGGSSLVVVSKSQ